MELTQLHGALDEGLESLSVAPISTRKPVPARKGAPSPTRLAQGGTTARAMPPSSMGCGAGLCGAVCCTSFGSGSEKGSEVAERAGRRCFDPCPEAGLTAGRARRHNEAVKAIPDNCLLAIRTRSVSRVVFFFFI